MTESLQRGQTYHIYTRGNNKENIFHEQKNYHYFLSLYLKHIEPIAHTYAYCLMRNHLHLLVRIKTTDELTSDLTNKDQTGSETSLVWSSGSSAPLRGHLATSLSLTKGFTKNNAVPEHYLKAPSAVNRSTTNDTSTSSSSTFIKTHKKHGFVNDFRNWPYSSYNGIISTQPSQLKRDVVLELFDGRQAFMEQHKEPIDLDEG